MANHGHGHGHQTSFFCLAVVVVVVVVGVVLLPLPLPLLFGGCRCRQGAAGGRRCWQRVVGACPANKGPATFQKCAKRPGFVRLTCGGGVRG